MFRYGHSIFCDDIRNEEGGKLTFVGCYNGVMYVPEQFPLTFPKFCIHFYVVSPESQPYRSIVARCYMPGQVPPFAEQPIESPAVDVQRRLVDELETAVSAPRHIVASASFVFAPLSIKVPGLISMRAVIDGASEELRLGSLRVVAVD